MTLIETLLSVAYAYLVVATLAVQLDLARRIYELAEKADERAGTTGENHYVIDEEWGLELISHDELMDGIYAATPRNAILYTARGY